MSNVEDFFLNESSLFIAGNNSPLMLHGSGNVWFIKSGTVNVFSVLSEEDEPVGARVYLFTLGAGDILFGMDNEPSGRSFLAVGNTEVSLYRADTSKLLDYASNSECSTQLAHMVDKWILSLSSGVARDSSLRYDISIDKSTDLCIPENKKIRSKKGVLWINTFSDNITLLDSELTDFEGQAFFPVTDNSWLLTLKAFNSCSLYTHEIIKDHCFLDYLNYYHNQILILEELNIRMLLVDDFVRNKEKIEIQNRTGRQALNNIAAMLGDFKAPDDEIKTDDLLFEACRILGKYHGIKITGPSAGKDGNPIRLSDIARASKFGFRKVTLDDGWWKTDSGALLSFTKDKNLPAVLIPDAAGHYSIKIPAENINTRLTGALAGRLVNYAFSFYKPFPLKKITIIEFIKFILHSCKKEFTLLLFAGSAGGLLTLFLPLLTGVIIDSVIPQSDKTKLLGLGISLVLSVIALIFAQIIRSLSYIKLDTKIDYLVQSALWDRLINMPVGFFKKFSSGELSAKANSISVLKQILTYSVTNTFIYNAFMIFNLLLLFYYDLFLGFLSAIVFALYLVIVFFTGLKIKDKNYNIIQYENSIASLMTQTLNSISKIKIAGTENLAFKLWTDKYALKQNDSTHINRYSGIIVVLNSIFPVLAAIFIFYLFSSGRYSLMSTGEMLSFLSAFNVFLLSIVQISNASIMFFMAAPLYENSKEILYSLPEYSEIKEPVKDLKGEIEISHAYFRYSGESEYVLSDVSMTVKPGEFVAVVGSSGSGKSTLLRLLLGFESPELGAVYFDKQNIESIDKSMLRRQIGTVMQNSKLFPGNIYSNIAGVNNLSVNEVTEITKMVGLDEDLKTMPMGVFTAINEGVSTLSGGQRQKILIAKALINKPAVLLLDEATSALDNDSQNTITGTIAKTNASKVIIAHRLSTIKEADRIYVLEKGRINGCGTYDELMQKNGVFSELVKRQLME